MPVIPPPTTRLTFRCWTAEDAPLAASLWCDPEVTRHFGGAMTPEQAMERLHMEREQESLLGIQYWPIFLRENGQFAGCAGMRPWSLDPNKTEVGVHLMRSLWGLRLGEEALLAVLAHGFNTLCLPMIVTGHGVAHANSRKLLERVGFQYIENCLWGPAAIEVCVWSLTAESWHQAWGDRAARTRPMAGPTPIFE